MTHTTKVFCEHGCGRSRTSTNTGRLYEQGWGCVTCRRALPIGHPQHLAALPKRTAAERAAAAPTTPRRTSAQVARERAVLARLEALHPVHLAAALQAEATAHGFASWSAVEVACSGPRGPVREAAWQVRGRRSEIAEHLGWLGLWREAVRGMRIDADVLTPRDHPLAHTLLAAALATAEQVAA